MVRLGNLDQVLYKFKQCKEAHGQCYKLRGSIILLIDALYDQARRRRRDCKFQSSHDYTVREWSYSMLEIEVLEFLDRITNLKLIESEVPIFGLATGAFLDAGTDNNV